MVKDTSKLPRTRKNWKKRPTFGFLLASLHTGASRALWPGLIDSAVQHDVNLICFPGGRLGAQVAHESQRNVIYDLAGKTCLDGMVTWASALGGVISSSEINAFHRRYQPLPVVSLGQFMEGMPTVSVDSYHGMRVLLEHLVEQHGYRRLAFIRGPEEHFYAQERYRAYLDTMQAYDIPIIPELVTRPLRWEAGAEAVKILLDERGLQPGVDFQAIVAVSDLLALWALKALENRGFRVPGDVAVTGFNNSIEERLATPPLTTIELPFYDQGAKAVETLLAQWQGKAVPALITLPSRLILRQSCGCPSMAVAQAASLPAARNKNTKRTGAEACSDLQASRSMILAEMVSAVTARSEKSFDWFGAVLDAFLFDYKEDSNDHFIGTLEDVLDQFMRENGDPMLWHGAMSELRKWVLKVVPTSHRNKIELSFAQAHIVISEAVQRSHAFWQWRAERQADNLRETARILLTTFDLPGLTGALKECLPKLGIPSAYLALYEENEWPLDNARLVMAYTDEKNIPIDPQGRRFQAAELVPSDLLPNNRRYSLVVEPLFFQDKALGYVVFEIGPRDGDVYELLRSNLSSALQGAHLFREIQQARITAEKADRIKTRLLANVSHELRTPLNIILGYTQNALKSPSSYPQDLPSFIISDLQHIHQNAEHQLRVINDLLDLSRAEINELDISLELIDPHPLLAEAFHNLADQSDQQKVQWRLEIPEQLPVIRADALRLRQIFLNLLSNARKFTQKGSITLGAEVMPPKLHIWISDTGIGIPPEQQERIFEPFVTVESDHRIAGGIGLGLTISRHLIALHQGTLELESHLGEGSTFHIYLPLPVLEGTHVETNVARPVILSITSSKEFSSTILEISHRQKIEIRQLSTGDDLEAILADVQPAAIAWDLALAQPEDWTFIRRLRHYPRFTQTPFILYGSNESENANEPAGISGLTGFLVKTTNEQSLLDLIDTLCPTKAEGLVLIVDDDPLARNSHKALVQDGLTGCRVKLAENGETALQALEEETPTLVILDMVMPGMSGADVLDHMRANPRFRQVPVVILSNKVLSREDVKRMETHARVTFQSKGLLSGDETIAALNRAILGTDSLPPQTSAVVKKAISYLHENFTRALSRWEIASAAGVSDDYLSRVFGRELGITPWDYLNRYRIQRSKDLLRKTSENIGNIAMQVGFKDQAYFSRVFHNLIGCSPQAFRDGQEES
jgi:signal transduction histidine kinase/DNA-binding LacI/PurR family transcriptional regulator/AraC-like DNA-binding protein/DNA-binding response OmpR family regulator